MMNNRNSKSSVSANDSSSEPSVSINDKKGLTHVQTQTTGTSTSNDDAIENQISASQEQDNESSNNNDAIENHTTSSHVDNESSNGNDDAITIVKDIEDVEDVEYDDKIMKKVWENIERRVNIIETTKDIEDEVKKMSKKERAIEIKKLTAELVQYANATGISKKYSKEDSKSKFNTGLQVSAFVLPTILLTAIGLIDWKLLTAPEAQRLNPIAIGIVNALMISGTIAGTFMTCSRSGLCSKNGLFCKKPDTTNTANTANTNTSKVVQSNVNTATKMMDV